jgi:hypothetical protein
MRADTSAQIQGKEETASEWENVAYSIDSALAMANTPGPEILLRLGSYLKFLSSNNAPTARSIGRYNVPPNLK